MYTRITVTRKKIEIVPQIFFFFEKIHYTNFYATSPLS